MAIKFGTDGWRAIIAEEFTFDNVVLVTKAIAAYIKTVYDPSKPVIVGYDTRFMADKFAKKAAETLSEYGLNVMLSDSYSPTPAIAFAAKNLNSAGALMFTASHNPAEYCGIKYIPDYAGPASKDITDVIVENVTKLQADNTQILPDSQFKGNIDIFSPKKAYLSEIKKFIDIEKIKNAGIKAVVDPMYATARGYIDELLKDAGVSFTMIHDRHDPLYGGMMPDPKPKYLKELQQLVVNSYPSIGLSNDGDADRFGIYDEKGNFVSPNEIIALLMRHLIKNKGKKGSVVRTVAASRMIDSLAEKYGVEVHEVAVGFKWICEVMRREDVLVGGEESGGLSILGHIPEKDGILANMAVLEAIAYENKPLFEIIEDLKKEAGAEFINDRIDLHLTESTKKMAMDMFYNNPPEVIGGLSVKNINKIDGVKIYFEDETSWILIRPSGTEPVLRIYFETDSKEKLSSLQDNMQNIVNGL
jgi:alpha-D-glucose phosphate-specific phosphoglucomutase